MCVCVCVCVCVGAMAGSADFPPDNSSNSSLSAKVGCQGHEQSVDKCLFELINCPSASVATVSCQPGR